MASDFPITVETGRNDPASVNRLLRALPDWFGIEESIVQYVSDAESKPTYLAVDDSGDVVGALLLSRHNDLSAEIHLLAVAPMLHRRGIGRQLVDRVEGDMIDDGVELLSVKTQGPSMPDENYRLTLQFYEAMGFVQLEEVTGLWPGIPALILVKPLVGARTR
jgi:ribosomal protein S18 acetylase RimI-like enzyme